jgi:methionine-rich copper-binding protein CopC
VAGTNNTATNGSQYVRLYNVATGVRINVNVGYTAGTRTFSINPSANLAVGTTYEVRVTPGTCTPPAGIRTATSCRPLNAVTTWQFTTANPAAVAPTVTAQTPAPGAAGVARGANLTVTFSEPMNAAGFNATSVRIVRVNNNTVIPATLTYNAGNRTLTINPDVNLRQATQFRVTLTGSATGIRDLDSPLNKPLVTTSFTFTTA